ncbi:DNA recombination protein RmuC [Teredinibacter turnerae]|uniref:DNA recombination protein RmuC n=1 Tax=Teredinibacter turnerae TaxID=2426 RepID=UPI0005F766C3|nr:DNA recombination protein RmuC [Teredinibacter turnerae]
MFDISQLQFLHLLYAFLAGIAFVVPLSVLIFWIRLAAREKSIVEELQLSKDADERAQIDSLHQKDIAIARLEAELESNRLSIGALREELSEAKEYRSKYVQMETRFEEQRERLDKEKSLLEEAREKLFREFELSANKLFETKQEKFTVNTRQNMESILSPFKEQLKAFNQRVEDVYHKENSQRNQLVGQIAELQKQTQKISSEANNLAAALKGDNKTQGNWGEIVLERLLEQSGLQKGSEYETQRQYSSEEGRRYRPDVIVHLPEGKDIVIDAKVSLTDYERYCQLEDRAEQEGALKKHVDSLRAHIKGLSLKSYEQLEGVRTLDFVFIFIPIEAAYIAAMQFAPGLFKEGYDRNIVLVSPSSLMVALRTVETLWRYEKQNKNAEKIAESAGKLYDQFVLLISAMEEVGQYIGKTSQSYDKAIKRLSTGRGNLVKRAEDLRVLGAKTSRQLPDHLKDDAGDSALELEGSPGNTPKEE